MLLLVSKLSTQLNGVTKRWDGELHTSAENVSEELSDTCDRKAFCCGGSELGCARRRVYKT